jgi:hypothetical protein
VAHATGRDKETVGIYNRGAVGGDMETTSATDKRVGFPLLFAVIAVLAAVGMAVFGITGDQPASGAAFGTAMVAGSLAVAAYHVFE